MNRLLLPKILAPREYEVFLKGCKNKEKSILSIGEIIFDLSTVEYIDIACLLHLISVFSYFSTQNIDLLIVLPEGENGRRSRDFLKRWKFYDALRECVSEPLLIIQRDQRKYFDKALGENYEEQKYYLRRTIKEGGIVHELISKNIVEIYSCTKQYNNAQTVNEGLIQKYTNRFRAERDISEVIAKTLGLSIKSTKTTQKKGHSYEIFYRTFIYESLINTKHHPNATLSLIAISTTPSKSHLVISVVDNGESIPHTISKVYNKYLKELLKDESSPRLFPLPKIIDLELDKNMSKGSIKDAEKIFFSCHANVTSKKYLEYNIGMGLTYLVRDTIRLNGQVVIRSNSASIRFFNKKSRPHCNAIQVTKWSGTSIRIQLPVKSFG